MVLADFIKRSKFCRHKVNFFQTTYRQFNFYNGVVDYSSLQNERWYYHTKHAKSKLSILNGHYGLYYTMYNHDEKRPASSPDLRLALTLRNFQNSIVVEIYIPNFTISQANIQIHQNLDALKNVVLKQLFSPLSIIIPKLKLTSKRYYTQNHKEAPKVVELNEDDKEQINRIKESVQPTDTFLYSQIDKISELYQTNEPGNLDLIYPIYQAIIRNGFSLPSVELYDIVLSSIVARNLDSNHDIESIESKLTTLLTVYQQLLHEGIKPSSTTYNIIINELLCNSLTVKSAISNDFNQFALNHYLIKSQDFAKMGIDIFESIKQFNSLDLDRIFPNLLSCLINFPELGSQNLMSKIISITTIRNEQVCTSLIELTSSFSKYPLLFESSQERYKYIVSVYSDYKDVCSGKDDEFKVYSLLIQSLVCNGHIKLASKFLDDVLSDYKSSLC
jgi:ribonuclease P protein component